MATPPQVKTNRRYAYAIGIGLAIFPIHNQWLARVTEINGEAILFLPVFGAVIWILATLFFLRDNYRNNPRDSSGKRS